MQDLKIYIFFCKKGLTVNGRAGMLYLAKLVE